MGLCGGGLGWSGMGWGGLGILGPILSLVFSVGLLGVLGLGVVWAIRQLGRDRLPARAPRTGDEPLEIARRRLAAGEISVAEFEEIRGRLQP